MIKDSKLRGANPSESQGGFNSSFSKILKEDTTGLSDDRLLEIILSR